MHLETDSISLVFGFWNKKGLLPWVVTTLVLASTCFSLLFFDRRTSMNSRRTRTEAPMALQSKKWTTGQVFWHTHYTRTETCTYTDTP